MKFLPIQAGDLTMLLDLESGSLRQIRFRGRDIVLSVYAAVRDRDWNTVSTALSNLVTQVGQNSFRITFDASCQRGAIDFRWHGTIVGTSQGKVTFTFDGEARSTFERNRIGICVLHPIQECRGARARVVQKHKKKKTLRFPERIDPQIRGNPRFGEMRALAYEVTPGIWAHLHFTGDDFEMEDQRNWTDASFKTYCTPLEKKFPVRIRSGTRVRQSVTLRLSGVTARRKTCTTSDLLRVSRVAAHPLPRIGLGIASLYQPLRGAEIEPLKQLGLSHLRADLWLGEQDWKEKFASCQEEARGVGAKLELAIHLPGQDCEQELRCLSTLARNKVSRILIFRDHEEATSLEVVRMARRFLDSLRVPIGGGSDTHFCELNRAYSLGLFGVAHCDFVSWPITPQVHALDDLTLMENIGAQSDTVISARVIAGKRPLMVSPITLRPRFNAVATCVLPSRPTPEADPRQTLLMTAAWTLGSFAALATHSVSNLTFFETSGPRGVLNREMVYPVYHVFAALVGFERMSSFHCSSPTNTAAVALFRRGALSRVVIANLRSEASPIRLAIAAERAHLHWLEESHREPYITHPKRMLRKGKCIRITKNLFETMLAPYSLGILDLV